MGLTTMVPVVTSKSVAWILLEGHRNLPDAFDTLDLALYQLDSRQCPNVTIFSTVTEWDWRRANRNPSKRAPRETVSSIYDLSRMTGDSILVASGPRALAEQLSRDLDRNVHWLSIGGFGATDRRAVWADWLGGAKSITIELDLYHDGKRRQRYGARELRIHRSSPALTQVGLLIASFALVERLASGADPEPDLNGPQAFQIRPTVILSMLRSGLQSLRISVRIVSKTLWNRLSRTHRLNAQWVIGIGRTGAPNSEGAALTLPQFRDVNWIQPSPHRYIADPFLVRLGGNVILFFEELLYSDRKGRLKALPLDSNGRPAGPETTVLERPYHLSFPFVFVHPAEPESIFLLPEQSESGDTVLYRSVRTVDTVAIRFHEDVTLLPGFPGIDPVIHAWQERYYLFVTNGSYGNEENNLQLFTSKNLRGPYHPHPKTPIKLGLRGSRMAGPFFKQGGMLFRPAQDCLSRYGARIVFYRVDLLSPSEYHETEVATFSPDPASPYACGCHTIMWHEGLVAIDGLRQIAVPEPRTER